MRSYTGWSNFMHYYLHNMHDEKRSLSGTGGYQKFRTKRNSNLPT